MIVHHLGYSLLPYRDPDAIPSWRIQKAPSGTFNGGTAETTFIVDGHLTGKMVENATFYPVVCGVPGGIAGTFDGVADGAYLVSVDTSFVSWKGYARIFDNSIHGVSRDGSILFTNSDEPSMMEDPFNYKSAAGSAWVVRHDRRVEIGPAESASIEPDGTVWGNALRRPNGAYCGESYPFPDARPEAFVWRAGVRHALGDWIPEGRNAKGTMVGYRLPPGQPKLAQDAKPSLWVRWRKGRLERLDLSKLGSVEAVRLRADDSLLVIAKTVGRRRLFAWRPGRAELIPGVVAGHRMDWSTLWVDRHDAVSVKDTSDRRWRIVRRG